MGVHGDSARSCARSSFAEADLCRSLSLCKFLQSVDDPWSVPGGLEESGGRASQPLIYGAAHTHQLGRKELPSRADHEAKSGLAKRRSLPGGTFGDGPNVAAPKDLVVAEKVGVCSRALVLLFLKLTVKAPAQGSGKTNAGKTQQVSRGGAGSSRIPTKRGKRKQLQPMDGGADEEEQRDNPDPKRRAPSFPAGDSPDLVACPFNKYNEYLFGIDSRNEDYHTCGTFKTDNTWHLKQHIQRTHRDTVFCPRCSRSFKKDDALAELAAHLQVPVENMCQLVQPPLYHEPISQTLARRLTLLSGQRCTEPLVTYWHRLYNGLFPGGGPVSPFFEAITSIQLRGRLFQQYARMMLPSLLPLYSYPGEAPFLDDLHDQVNEYVNILIHANDLYENYQRNCAMPVLGVPQPRTVFPGLPNTRLLSLSAATMDGNGEGSSAAAAAAPAAYFSSSAPRSTRPRASQQPGSSQNRHSSRGAASAVPQRALLPAPPRMSAAAAPIFELRAAAPMQQVYASDSPAAAAPETAGSLKETLLSDGYTGWHLQAEGTQPSLEGDSPRDQDDLLNTINQSFDEGRQWYNRDQCSPPS